AMRCLTPAPVREPLRFPAYNPRMDKAAGSAEGTSEGRIPKPLSPRRSIAEQCVRREARRGAVVLGGEMRTVMRWSGCVVAAAGLVVAALGTVTADAADYR